MNKKGINMRIIGIIILLIIIGTSIWYCTRPKAEEVTIEEGITEEQIKEITAIMPKLIINNTQTCKGIDQEFNCMNETTTFEKGEIIQIKTDIYIEAINGKTKFYETIGITDIDGNLILPITDDSITEYEENTEEGYNKIPIRDMIITDQETEEGLYYIHLIIGSFEWNEEQETIIPIIIT